MCNDEGDYKMRGGQITFSTAKKISPCKKCKKRFVGCHSTCQKYIEWNVENEKLRKKFIEDNYFVGGNENWSYTRSRKG